ncbi:MAG: PEP-CTERM sorting domain-containing protein [Planctomycetales bacterium]|nr:PEP-CTERM sorting domain-containing protein [Planctomycetales bacterium]
MNEIGVFRHYANLFYAKGGNSILRSVSNPNLPRTYAFSIGIRQQLFIPEPTTFSLFSLAFLALSLVKCRRRRR